MKSSNLEKELCWRQRQPHFHVFNQPIAISIQSDSKRFISRCRHWPPLIAAGRRWPPARWAWIAFKAVLIRLIDFVCVCVWKSNKTVIQEKELCWRYYWLHFKLLKQSTLASIQSDSESFHTEWPQPVVKFVSNWFRFINYFKISIKKNNNNPFAKKNFVEDVTGYILGG